MPNRVQYYRRKIGLSQSELARLVGVSRNTISSIERCEYIPTLKTAFKLAKVLNVDINVLFKYID